MKVWRGFTLIFWTVVLTLCFAVALFYYVLQGTVLNGQATKEHLASSGTYEALRDGVVTDKLIASLGERYPDNKLVDRALLGAALAETFPKQELRKELEPVVDVIYAWLDSKRPDITFEIPVGNREEQFYRSLEVHLSEKIAALPDCGDYRYPPDQAILNDLCLPAYVTAEEATQAAMDSIRGGQSPFGDTITTDTFALPVTASGQLKSFPTYLNYLWTLNYVLLAVAALTTLLLLVSRRIVGLLAVGIAATLAGIVLWVTKTAIGSMFAGQGNSLEIALRNALIPPFTSLAERYALIAILGGLLTIAATSTWLWWRRGKSHA